MSETAEVLPFTGPAKKDLYEVGEIRHEGRTDIETRILC